MKDVLSFEDLARMNSLSLMKWDSSNYASENTQLAQDFYREGQQSKQAEVDALRKRIDDAMSLLQTRKHSADVTNLIFHMHEILKGGSDES